MLEEERKLKHSLEELGYSEENIRKLMPSLLKNVMFLQREGGTLSNAYYNFADKIKKLGELLGVEREQLKHYALLHPSILFRNPETVYQNAQLQAERLGIGYRNYIGRLIKAGGNAFFKNPDVVYARALEMAGFLGMPLNKYNQLCLAQPSLFGKDPERMKEIARQASKMLGLTKEQYVTACKKEPSLLYKAPETTVTNVRGCAELLGITAETYLTLVYKQKQEQLLVRSPETFKNTIEKFCSHFALDEETFKKSVQKRLTAMAYDPQILIEKIGGRLGEGKVIKQGYVQALKINIGTALKACLATPQLLTLNVEEVGRKVDGIADILDVDRDKLAEKLAKRGPNMLYQTVESVREHVETAIRLMGVSRSEFADMAMKKPNILWRDPETMALNKRLMERFHDKGILTRDVMDFIKASPDRLCMAPDNFYLRYIFARKSGLEPTEAFSVLRLPRGQIERKVVELYGHNADQREVTRPSPRGLDITVEEAHHRALVAMIRSGIISTYSYKPEGSKLTP